MSEEIHPFRGATFGGFHRQDVLDYLAKIQEEHTTTVTQLQQELEEARARAGSNESRLCELEELTKQSQDSSSTLSEELSTAKTALEKSEQELTIAQNEVRDLRSMVAELEPKATAYTRIKERAASIELDAHERAQLATEGAQNEITVLRQDCLRWMHGVQADYSRLRGNLSSTFSQSARELERVCELFERMLGDFDVHEENLQDMLQRAEEITGEAEE